ncbi:MAG: CDP-diacylglycerol--glycerol-3-phosphate 3-phosphatidyltransferase [Puniceicoccales bacterium]|nr:CDP-diacylglycerol--glycerol-3-phosphate 3-phosphatidyltransferase [Puniceicoccales bacterium]
MNIANWVTLSRIPFLFLIVLLLYIPVRFCATWGFIMFVVAALTDWYDGYLARHYGMVSAFGKLMDALSDKILMIGLWMTILTFKIIPQWTLFFILLILAREFLITGLRLIASVKSVVLEAEKLGKLKTIAQIFSTGFFIMWYALMRDRYAIVPDFIVGTAYGLGVLFFVISVYLTMDSGIRYLVKYRHLLLQMD